MVLYMPYRTPAVNDENKQGLKTGALTAGRKLLWECGGSVLNVAPPLVSGVTGLTPSTSVFEFFLEEKWRSHHSKNPLIERQGAESNGAWQ